MHKYSITCVKFGNKNSKGFINILPLLITLSCQRLHFCVHNISCLVMAISEQLETSYGKIEIGQTYENGKNMIIKIIFTMASKFSD